MILAGRCACGLLRELATEDPEPHLACNGQRRCLQCETVKPLVVGFAKAGHGRRSTCKVCLRPKQAEYRRIQRRADPGYRTIEAERVKEYRVYGPKTGIRKGPQPRNHPSEKPCSVCHVVKPDAEFVIRKGKYRRAKCESCWRIHNKARRRELERRRYLTDPVFAQKHKDSAKASYDAKRKAA